MNKTRALLLLFGLLLIASCLCVAFVNYFPAIYSSLAWRIDEAVLRFRYTVNPPAREVFVPQGVLPTVSAQLPVATLLPVATATPGLTSTPGVTLTPGGPTSTPLPTFPPTQIPAPLPGKTKLTGVRYEDQHGRFNYCAPANLSMALSYWGWDGNRDTVGPVLKPDPKDKNVMPYEMANYVMENTDLRALVRVGGDLDTLKRFLAGGFPVLVEKGAYFHDLTGVLSWMGHYTVIIGYDDADETFLTQDSFVKPEMQVLYEDMLREWRAFNYTYLIIYPPEKEAQVAILLGTEVDETVNFGNAAARASNEVYGLSGIDQYFAWYNRGSNLVALQDYAGAAEAYDEAFAVYPTIPEAERPWRMLWYNTGPYFAYFYSGRYYDVLYLADGTLNAMQSDKNLEESYYWRGMARAALGDTAAAVEDFRLALQYHPGFEPAIYQLRLLGVES